MRLVTLAVSIVVSQAFLSCSSCENYVAMGGQLSSCRDGHIQVKFGAGQEVSMLGTDPDDALIVEIEKVSNRRSQQRVEVWLKIENRLTQEVRFDRYEVELNYQGRVVTAQEVGINRDPNIGIYAGKTEEKRWIFDLGVEAEAGVYPMTLKNVRTQLNDEVTPIGELVVALKVPGLPGSTPYRSEMPEEAVAPKAEEKPAEEPAEEETPSEDDFWGVGGETGNATNPIDQ